MNSSFLFGLIKDVLIFLIYPIVTFLGKKVLENNRMILDKQQNHEIRVSIAESRLDSLSEDIQEIKTSIDRLPDRIKSDIKDLIYGQRK